MALNITFLSTKHKQQSTWLTTSILRVMKRLLCQLARDFLRNIIMGLFPCVFECQFKLLEINSWNESKPSFRKFLLELVFFLTLARKLLSYLSKVISYEITTRMFYRQFNAESFGLWLKEFEANKVRKVFSDYYKNRRVYLDHHLSHFLCFWGLLFCVLRNSKNTFSYFDTCFCYYSNIK